MQTLAGPAVILDAADCPVLGRQLVEAVRLAYVARGRTPPRLLLQFADLLNCAGRSSAAAPGTSRSEGGSRQQNTGTGADRAWWRQPDIVLTVAGAAQAAGVSHSYIRRLCREGTVYAVQAAPAGQWLIDAEGFAGWQRERQSRTATTREA